jgi:hypothetical protein
MCHGRLLAISGSWRLVSDHVILWTPSRSISQKPLASPTTNNVAPPPADL